MFLTFRASLSGKLAYSRRICVVLQKKGGCRLAGTDRNYVICPLLTIGRQLTTFYV